MLLIGRLKRYGFSLTEIQALLTIPDSRELLRQLYKQRFRLERQMEHISITIREMGYHLEEFERTGDIMSYQNNYEIQIKEAEEQVLVTGETRCQWRNSAHITGRYMKRLPGNTCP